MRIFTLIKKMSIGTSIVVLIGTGCIVNPSESTLLLNVPAWYLLLDVQAFPKGWEPNPCDPSSRLCFGDTHALRSFGRVVVPGHVIQNVYRLHSVEVAKAKFQKVREVDFRPRQLPNMQFASPPEIAYWSPVADEYYFGCGVDRVPGCEAIFRYANYYVEFYFDLDQYRGYGLDYEGDGLKLEEVEPVLRAMDARAAAVLGIPLPTKSP